MCQIQWEVGAPMHWKKNDSLLGGQNICLGAIFLTP
jgi:hypothetical protein